MAASVCALRNLRIFCSLLRIPREIRLTEVTRRTGNYGACGLFCNSRRTSLLAAFQYHTSVVSHTLPSAISVTDKPDTLYRTVLVVVKGHDRSVLDSYETFATTAARELGIHISQVTEPKRKIERLTLLKSIHIFKKHRVQYEMRTHYRCLQFSHLTGSTTRVFLEYIQRNLPEGVAMEVTKTAMEKIPEHIRKPLWGSTTQKEAEGQ